MVLEKSNMFCSEDQVEVSYRHRATSSHRHDAQRRLKCKTAQNKTYRGEESTA